MDQDSDLIYKAEIDLYRSKLKPISRSDIDLSYEQTITFNQFQNKEQQVKTKTKLQIWYRSKYYNISKQRTIDQHNKLNW